jgi:hypothetical protein
MQHIYNYSKFLIKHRQTRFYNFNKIINKSKLINCYSHFDIMNNNLYIGSDIAIIGNNNHYNDILIYLLEKNKTKNIDEYFDYWNPNSFLPEQIIPLKNIYLLQQNNSNFKFNETCNIEQINDYKCLEINDNGLLIEVNKNKRLLNIDTIIYH